MNSPFVLRQVKAEPGSYLAQLLDEKRPVDENVERLFMRFLQRQPAANEVAMSKDLVATRGQQGYEDLQWLLLNKVEFVFNY